MLIYEQSILLYFIILPTKGPCVHAGTLSREGT